MRRTKPSLPWCSLGDRHCAYIPWSAIHGSPFEFVQRCVDSNCPTDQGNQQWNIEADTVWGYAAPTRLEQIIDNVLSNAIRYTPAGASIRIRFFEKDLDGVIEVIHRSPGLKYM